ncbi:MAG: hypothetical protein DRQ55_06350 [Planctomycetota bacterium]|nr:MAG: hypothetical protein DRQ55_06350 [Planctomycetota bacterium]
MTRPSLTDRFAAACAAESRTPFAGESGERDGARGGAGEPVSQADQQPTSLTPASFFGRVLIFASSAFVLQLAIGSATLPEELALLHDVVAEAPDVLFFADSTNRAHDPGDSDRRWISAMLQDALAGASAAAAETASAQAGAPPLDTPRPGTPRPGAPPNDSPPTDGAPRTARHSSAPVVRSIDHAAYHPLVYRDWMAALLSAGARPRAAVFVLNTRSFLPGWSMRPGWQFERLRFSLAHPWLARLWQPLAVFRVLDGNLVTEREFRQTPIVLDGQPAGVVGDYLRGDPEALDTPELVDEDLALRLSCNYLGAIDPQHERVAALRELVALCREHDIEPLFYVTPVDVEAGEGLLPGRFRRQVAANAALLTKIVREAGGAALDLSLSTPAERFSWQRIPNEHMGQDGRAAVARAVATLLAPLLSEEPAAPR